MIYKTICFRKKPVLSRVEQESSTIHVPGRLWNKIIGNLLHEGTLWITTEWINIESREEERETFASHFKADSKKDSNFSTNPRFLFTSLRQPLSALCVWHFVCWLYYCKSNDSPSTNRTLELVLECPHHLAYDFYVQSDTHTQTTHKLSMKAEFFKFEQKKTRVVLQARRMFCNSWRSHFM